MDFRSTRCIFLGYSLNHKGYKCLDPTTNCIYIARNVVFDEHVYPFATSSNHPVIPLVPPSPIRLPTLTNSNHIPSSYPMPPTPKISANFSPTKSPTLSPQKSPPKSPHHSPTDSTSPQSYIHLFSISHDESFPPKSASPRVSTLISSSPTNDSLQVPCDDTQVVVHPMQTTLANQKASSLALSSTLFQRHFLLPQIKTL